mmetsp:Transcript_24795/g.44855  ORF Transcript_24795/g.44855 Transcript_24795/m.44855 type:complete len:120 (+) Transcript_24795:60-419(+)|eukprot:CAMPEP_0202481706 /NCGR_PEP_ID=MMETSP1361-20130828/1187_1 /ASSEMBLY_ACC=CAM_ASM_000849 /TAXON_ID=210615 /ORGANISM="Staurosira complex sp., Strain CCMP2646" /LENGTH=119 /DNA_ID=CAMNT_0049109263 /DNA_START=33 /DNA_END=392 /DNA_ORIENTATION=+
MIVQIQSADSNRETPEWALIELNGELVPPTDVPKEQTDKDDDNLVESDRMELGSLKFTPEGTPIIIVGSHELKGEVVTLKEPFCVMNKKRKRDENVEYTVVGVVTKKLLFTNYPKTIMR